MASNKSPLPVATTPALLPPHRGTLSQQTRETSRHFWTPSSVWLWAFQSPCQSKPPSLGGPRLPETRVPTDESPMRAFIMLPGVEMLKTTTCHPR